MNRGVDIINLSSFPEITGLRQNVEHKIVSNGEQSALHHFVHLYVLNVNCTKVDFTVHIFGIDKVNTSETLGSLKSIFPLFQRFLIWCLSMKSTQTVCYKKQQHFFKLHIIGLKKQKHIEYRKFLFR